MKYFSIKISGPAGMGVMQAGETFSKALNRLGFFTLVYPEYPSRIRGGDNHVQVVFSAEKYMAPVEEIDLLLAFGKENFERHKKEIGPTSPSESEGYVRGKGYEGGELGLTKIAEELGNPLVANTAGLGFIFKVLGFELKALEEQIEEEFKGKEEIKKLNLDAARRGYKIRVGSETCVGPTSPLRFGGLRGARKWEVGSGEKIVNFSGNEALTEGILKAGCEFAAIYPMTPINSILAQLAKSKVTLFRPEDEIAGIMSSLGASYAGKRSLVATSGGGFSLMVEGLGMAGMAEIPLVIVLGQRTGPSSGMATFSSQADLNFAISAGQGEFPRIILAPGDLEECYRLGAEAFNLAEKYQVPVILLTDKYLAESRFSVEEEKLKRIKVVVGKGKLLKDKNYKRYKFYKDGISPRAFPGQAVFLTNSYEHDENGFSSDDPENRQKMMEKRMGKLRDIDSLDKGYEGFGELEGKKRILVGWGSTKETILDFLGENDGFDFLHIYRPWPFPQGATRILQKYKEITVIEENFSGQMADLVEKFTGKKTRRILKDNGRPFFKEELESRIKPACRQAGIKNKELWTRKS